MIVRNLPPDVHRRLREMAEKNGISLEEQARRLLASGVGAGTGRSAGDVLASIRRRNRHRLADGEIEQRRGRIEPVDLP